jgi:hypothetical protein
MTINIKNCTNDLRASISRTRDWRRVLKGKYNDSRNGLAAELLGQIIADIDAASPETFAEVLPFYSWVSPTWSEAVSSVSREVGFRNVNDLPTYLDRLVSVLSQAEIAA